MLLKLQFEEDMQLVRKEGFLFFLRQPSVTESQREEPAATSVIHDLASRAELPGPEMDIRPRVGPSESPSSVWNCHRSPSTQALHVAGHVACELRSRGRLFSNM